MASSIPLAQAIADLRSELLDAGRSASDQNADLCFRRLIPIFEDGRFHLPETLVKVDYEGKPRDLVVSFVNEEYLPFPVGLHDDFFDALARICDPEMNLVWPKPTIPAEDRYTRTRKRAARRTSWMVA